MYKTDYYAFLFYNHRNYKYNTSKRCRKFKETREKAMISISCIQFHSILFLLLYIIWIIEMIRSEYKEIVINLKKSDDEKRYYPCEFVIMFVIIIFDTLVMLFLGLKIVISNETAARVFITVCGIAYSYIVIKQLVKMLFIPDNSFFSVSDLTNFVLIYMGWWCMLCVMYSIPLPIDIFEKIPSGYKDLVEVGILFLWHYFNILFAFGGTYISFCHICKFVKYLVNKFKNSRKRANNIVDKVCSTLQHVEKYPEIRSVRLWKENNGKFCVCKIFLTIPMLVLDVWKVTCRFVKIFYKTLFLFVIVSILDPIKVLNKYILLGR